MTHSPMHAREFLTGALIGGVVGGALALLFAPTAGKKIREGIAEACEGLGDQAESVLEEGKSLIASLEEEGQEFCEQAKATVQEGFQNTKEWVQEHTPCEISSPSTLVIGAAATGGLCFLLGYLLAPRQEPELRECLKRILSRSAHEAGDAIARKRLEFTTSTKKKTEKWLQVIRHLLQDFSHEVQSKKEEVSDRIADSLGHLHKEDLLEWAEMGLNLWKRLAKK